MPNHVNLTDLFGTVGHTKIRHTQKMSDVRNEIRRRKLQRYFLNPNSTCHIFSSIFYIFCRKKFTSPCGLPTNFHPETLSKWLFPQGWNPTDTEVGPRHPEKKSQLHGERWTVSWIYPLQDAIVTTVHSHFSHHSTVKSIWSMCILDLHPHPGCWLVTIRILKHFEVREPQLLN